jgi:hypothetical protein
MSILSAVRGWLRPQWHFVTLDDVIPMFGEGRTREEAEADLARGLRLLWDLYGEDPSRLHPHLEHERQFLARLLGPAAMDTVSYTSNAHTLAAE